MFGRRTRKKWHEPRRREGFSLRLKHTLQDRVRRLGQRGRWALVAVLSVACVLVLRASSSSRRRPVAGHVRAYRRRRVEKNAGDDDYDYNVASHWDNDHAAARRRRGAARRSSSGATQQRADPPPRRKRKRAGRPPSPPSPAATATAVVTQTPPHVHHEEEGPSAVAAPPNALPRDDDDGEMAQQRSRADDGKPTTPPPPRVVVRSLVEGHGGGVSALPSSSAPQLRSLPGLLSSLRHVEERANTLWNRSKVDVLVTGDSYYIKRDFPLYRRAFTAHGYDLRESAKQASGREQNKGAFLCFAIHTNPDCFSNTGTFGARNAQTKINRLPMIRRILWTKDRFCRTVNDATTGMAEALGPASVDFFFQCWVTPVMLPALLAHAQRRADQSDPYIVKPTDNGEGTGIYIEGSLAGLKKLGRLPALDNGRRPRRLVQTYLSDPHLINGFKWDLRTYVLVTSAYPLRAYVFHEGLVRFASTKYTKASKKKTAFLTNTSINKHKTGSASSGTWSFKQLEEHFTAEGHDYAQLFGRIKRAITLLLLSAEKQFYKRFVRYRHGCTNCYQLLGVDLILDSKMHPRVIETNGEPSMQVTKKDVGNAYDKTKRSMVHDLVALVYNKQGSALETAAALRGASSATLEMLRANFQCGGGDMAGDPAGGWGGDACAPLLAYLLDAQREGRALASGSGFTRLYPAPPSDGGLHDETTVFISHVVANSKDLVDASATVKAGGAASAAAAGGAFIDWAHRLPAHHVLADVLFD